MRDEFQALVRVRKSAAKAPVTANLPAEIASQAKKPIGLSLDVNDIEKVSAVLAKVYALNIAFRDSVAAQSLSEENRRALTNAIISSESIVHFISATPAREVAALLTAAARTKIADILGSLIPFASRYCDAMRATGRYQSAHSAEGALQHARDLQHSLKA